MREKPYILIIIILVFIGLGLLAWNRLGSKEETTYLGGVVPHHALVSAEIEKFWLSLSKQFKPKLIILIGPDHENAGKDKITTPEKAEVFSSKISLYAKTPTNLVKDDEVFSFDQSFTIHIPLIVRNFPRAQVLPIALRADAKYPELLNLANELKVTLKGKILVVSSVDFSHYKKWQDAEKFDEGTISAIKAFDYEKLALFGSEHLDSSQSIILMNLLVCPQKNCTYEEIFHGNSAQYPNQSPIVTTSYYSLILKP